MDKTTYPLFAITRLGDHALILGQRLSEWCGHGPVLEQDIALSNIALDLIGQARNWYTLAANLHPTFSHEDAFAFERNEREFTNFLLTEIPNGNWAQTIWRQFFFDAWHEAYLTLLTQHEHPDVAGIAQKSIKEVKYHLKWSSEWVIRLGNGTEVSKSKMVEALPFVWNYAGEWLEETFAEEAQQAGWPGEHAVKDIWWERVRQVMREAGIPVPLEVPYKTGSAHGIHTEWLGYILAEMQFLPKTYPGAQW